MPRVEVTFHPAFARSPQALVDLAHRIAHVLPGLEAQAPWLYDADLSADLANRSVTVGASVRGEAHDRVKATLFETIIACEAARIAGHHRTPGRPVHRGGRLAAGLAAMARFQTAVDELEHARGATCAEVRAAAEGIWALIDDLPARAALQAAPCGD